MAAIMSLASSFESTEVQDLCLFGLSALAPAPYAAQLCAERVVERGRRF